MYAGVNAETCLRRCEFIPEDSLSIHAFIKKRTALGQPQPMCIPVGGLSVYASPTPLESFDKSVPTVWVTAPLDGHALFPDIFVGAETPISGVVALLAVADALAKSGVLTSPNTTTANIVFALFAAESWSNTGSGRFVQDLVKFECIEPSSVGCTRPVRQSVDFQKFQMASIQGIIEIGSVGGSSEFQSCLSSSLMYD